ncbi:MAG: hypothetical protein GJV46_01740 [Geobacter sp.]|nr:hypothetical protein [Geobacter sp.]
MIKNILKYSWVTCVVALLLVVFLCPSDAHALLTGEAALRYDNYDVRDNSGRHLSANSFTQDYSILYGKSGNLYNSRIGRYNVSLGYNWSALDTSVKSTKGAEDLNSSRGHIYYRGEIVVDPKEVPFRLEAYSRDLTRNTFTAADTPLITDMFSRGGNLFGSPSIASGINDGVHIESGVTLVAGLKSGMTNGYNEVLRHLPMIMLDYSDQINKDLRSQTPVDTRLSRLAFVSLNKKDNWFHYRYVTYDDYINSENNYRESQFQIGTVDHKLARRWVDFSNWLQVSTDLQLTKRINNNMVLNYVETDLNLFVQAQRSKWEARSYNNFNRYREENGRLTYRTTIPLYVSGVLNPETSWSTRSSYKESHDNAGAHLESMLAGYRVEAFKRSLFTLGQHFDVESSTSELSELLVLSGGFETTSSSRFSQKISLDAAYDIKNSSYKDYLASSGFLEQKLTLRSSYTPTNQLRINLIQVNDFTSGSKPGFSSTVHDANTSLPQYVSPRWAAQDNLGSSSYRSVTTLSAVWNPMPRLNLGLILSEDIFASEKVKSSNITNASFSINYDNSQTKFSNMLTYSDGSSQVDQQASSLSNTTAIQHKYNRNLDLKLLFAYNRISDNNAVSNSYDFEQRLDYSLFSYSGLTRKLLEINEMLTFSDSPNLGADTYSTSYGYSNIISTNSLSSNNKTVTSGKNSTRSSLSLGFKYYPLRQLVLAAGGRYLYDNNINNYSLLWYSSIGVNFRLFQASLDYYQGKRQSDGLIEKKFTANVKKSF